jgi:hypothetical protein
VLLPPNAQGTKRIDHAKFFLLIAPVTVISSLKAVIRATFPGFHLLASISSTFMEISEDGNEKTFLARA